MAKLALALVLTLVLLAGACSRSEKGAGSPRTVRIEMTELAFEPDRVEIRSGEQVRFVFSNRGQLPHDAFVGDEEAQQEHEREMGAGNGQGMDHGGNASRGIIVQPGNTGEMTRRFEAKGGTLIGCHQPGHYAAGMKLQIAVT